MWIFIQSLINGLLAGGVYALIGVGITIVFGVMKIVNFAAGAYLVWGMYFTYLWYQVTGLNAYLLIPLVAMTMIIFGYATFKLTIKPVLNTGGTAFILVTVGLSFLLQNLIEVFFDPTPRTVPSSIKLSSLQIGSFSIGLPRLIAFAAMLVLVLFVNLLLNKTLFGRAMKATSESSVIARMLGINTDKTYTIAFIIGITFAGLAGLLITPLYYVTATSGKIFSTVPLMAVVLGGLGNIKGALIGGLLVGVVEAVVGSQLSPDLGPVGITLLFLVVVYLKPKGLFGKGERTA